MADNLTPQSRTLNLDELSGRDVANYVLSFAIILILLEAIGRLLTIIPGLPAPELAGDYMVGAKYERLKAFAAEGPIDCLIVGSSVVQQGIDPVALASAYQESAGESIRCFNFAIQGAAAPKMSWLTKILARQYKPRLIIYGVTYRDLLKAQDTLPNGWLAYRTGQFNIDGWLDDNSYAYRYYATLRWYLLAKPEAQLNREKYEPHLRPDGFVEIVGIWPHLDKHPNPIVGVPYTTAPSARWVLQELAALQSQGVQIILLEIPLPPMSKTLLLNGEEDYIVYINDVESIARENGFTYWPSLPPEDITIQGWADPIHLNDIGAVDFSRWLGHKLATDWAH